MLEEDFWFDVVRSTNVKEKYLTETSWIRLYRKMRRFDLAIISAFRPIDKESGEDLSLKQNRSRNKLLKKELVTRLGYGVAKVCKNWAEFVDDLEVEMGEESFLAVNVRDEKDFFEKMERLGQKYDQDAVLLKPVGKEACLLGTNESGYPGMGVVVPLSEFPVNSAVSKKVNNSRGRAWLGNASLAFENKREPAERRSSIERKKLRMSLEAIDEAQIEKRVHRANRKLLEEEADYTFWQREQDRKYLQEALGILILTRTNLSHQISLRGLAKMDKEQRKKYLNRYLEMDDAKLKDDARDVIDRMKKLSEELGVDGELIYNGDETFNVNGNVRIPYHITEIPIKFNTISGDFNCSETKITSLKNSPEKVVGDFNCSDNNITSLQDAPKVVYGNFNCSKTNITSLEGAPQEMKGFDCSSTLITSLKGAPQRVERYFDCSKTDITSLNYAPQVVIEDFDCSRTNITSLEGAPQEVGHFDCSNTLITSLKGAPKVVGIFNCSETPLESLEGCPEKAEYGFYCFGTKKKFTKEEIKAVCEVGQGYCIKWKG